MSAIIDYRGKTPTKTTFGVPLVTAKIVKGGRIEPAEEFIAEADYEAWMRRGLPEKGDIVMTTEAPLGEVAQLDGRKIALAQRVITLRGKEELLDNGFLRYLLQSTPVQDELKARATGTTVLGIKQSELRKISLTLPPLSEQKRIAHILGTLDDKIELNRQMNSTLEEMARALFQSWFVDFDPVRRNAEGGESRPEHSLFPDSFEDSELGKIPKGWKPAKASEICKNIFSGGTPRTSEVPYWDGTFPWLSSGETRNSFIIETEKTITQLGIDKSSTRLARKGCVVIASAGQGHTRGQTSLLAFDSYINQSVVALAADNEMASDLFLYFDLSRRYEEFRQLSDSHSSRGSLTTKLLGGVRVVLPAKDAIQKFDSIVNPMVTKIIANLQQSRALANLRDTLLPKLLSGEVTATAIPERSHA
ncbi:restriction endonuclease subunit S [Luteolibacter sp. LG18]|uniref:restriction endonuclease subunit S n=1 Tax=Luteolibacter sp. LG18 TaxID=2819286 RepID=UPI0030C7122A